MKQPTGFYVELYGNWVVPLLGWTHEAAEQFIFEKMGHAVSVSKSPGSTTFVKNENNDLVCFICIDDFNPFEITHLGLLCHECLHAAMWILDDVGQESVNMRDHEYLTYLQQFIFVNCLQSWKDS